ncbi:MAG: hypothetical protein ACLFWL_11345 [Candidatus Brocadiia bacterium]
MSLKLKNHPVLFFLLLVALLIILAVVASWLIDTDREKVVRSVKKSGRSLEQGDVAGTLEFVSPNFKQETMGRKELRDFVKQGLNKFGAPKIKITKWQNLEVDATNANCKIVVITRFSERRSFGGQLVRSQWELTFEKSGDKWLITSLDPIRVQGNEVGGLLPLGRNVMGYQ